MSDTVADDRAVKFNVYYVLYVRNKEKSLNYQVKKKQLEFYIKDITKCFQIFLGNNDSHSVHVNELKPAPSGRKFRIYPLKYHDRPGLRFELLTCT